MRKRVTFQRQSEVKDNHGQRSEVWTDIVSRRARIQSSGGGESNPASGERAVVIQVFFIRYDSKTATIRPYDRALFNGQIYKITLVSNVHELNKDLEITCERDDAA